MQRNIEVALAASRLGAGIVSKGAGRAASVRAHQASSSDVSSPGIAFRRVSLSEYNAVRARMEQS